MVCFVFLCAELFDGWCRFDRAKLNNRTPMEAFAFLHGTEALKLLGCKLIEPNCVMLTPKLLKR